MGADKGVFHPRHPRFNLLPLLLVAAPCRAAPSAVNCSPHENVRSTRKFFTVRSAEEMVRAAEGEGRKALEDGGLLHVPLRPFRLRWMPARSWFPAGLSAREMRAAGIEVHGQRGMWVKQFARRE